MPGITVIRKNFFNDDAKFFVFKNSGKNEFM